MSGFAVIVDPAATIAAESVETAARRLAWRGPDASGRWCCDGTILLHSLFRTTDESAAERQPMGDQRMQITGDVRLDARHDLIAALRRAGSAVSATAPDIELVAAAWQVWRDDCVRHLRGDFSFVIWDCVERRLFGARDHFGVRPFFYTAHRDCLVATNDLAAVRACGLDPESLDDEAVVDVLAFGRMQSPAATVFAGIRRLPAGHTLSWHAGSLHVRRYWTGIEERPVRFARDADYVEAYRELLTRAVSDRLRTTRVAITLTGGLDSSSIAATVATLRTADLHAHTIVYDQLIPDRERHFAQRVAAHLGVPINFVQADAHRLYERDTGGAPPEPIDDPFRTMLSGFYRGIAAADRVLLMGLDGDTLLCEIASDYLLAQLRRGRVGEYARGVRDYIRTRRELPPHRLRSSLRRWTRGARTPAGASTPAWLDRDLVQRFRIDERWAAKRATHDRLQPGWPLRPRATSVMASPVWTSMFDEHDAASLGARLEVRYPLADLALVEFLINIPAVPWCIDKFIVRRAMADRLPAEVLARPKTALAGDPIAARLNRGDALPWTKHLRVHRDLARYVDVQMLSVQLAAGPSAMAVGIDTRALMLNEWLWYHRPRS
jgi:asparagine synthase (glutamine-hydrolysing)